MINYNDVNFFTNTHIIMIMHRQQSIMVLLWNVLPKSCVSERDTQFNNVSERDIGPSNVSERDTQSTNILAIITTINNSQRAKFM